MKSGGQCTDVDGLAELNLTVVSLAEDGGIEKVALQRREPLRRNGEVALFVVVEAGNMSSKSNDAFADFPDNNGDRHRAADDHQVLGKITVCGFSDVLDGLLFWSELVTAARQQ